MRWLQVTKGIFADAILPLPIGYYFLVHHDCLQLLRVSRFSTKIVAERRGPTDCASVGAFLSELRSTGSLPFVPIAVLLDGPRCFVATWRAKSFSSDQVVQRVTMVRHAAATLTQTIATAGNQQFLVVQGIDREYREELQRTLTNAGVQTLFVATLAGQLTLANLKRFAGKSCACLFCWSTLKTTFLGVNERGEVFSGAFPCDDTTLPVDKVSYLKQTFSLSSEQDLTVTVVTATTPSSASYSHWLAARPPMGKPIVQIQHHLPHSGRARAVYVALGSLKLFNLIASTTLALGLAWLGVAHWLLPNDLSLVHRYQSLYERKAVTQQLVDSLGSRTLITATLGGTGQTAALLSAFCQESTSGASLRGILARSEGDSVVVEVSGTAVDDMAVFECIDAAKRNCAPWIVQLTSVRPEAFAQSGQVDTLLSFKLAIRKEGKRE